ncbi:MAG: transposase [Candidatus Omnitrophica bacterium]|nr:transposase [Candidatus Omnitrophota bacterium]
MRKNFLAVGEIYHVLNKSIAGFQIFNDEDEYQRMAGLFAYYQKENPPVKFSKYLNSNKKGSEGENTGNKLVEIIAYCLMPTHLHLLLRQMKEEGISLFMGNVLNSYTRYFNTRHKRKGPLWEGRFKRIQVKTEENLLHLTRYIHLNPVTAYLVNKPEDWLFSSYREYLGQVDGKEKICNFEDSLEIGPDYKEFVEDRISYQRELAQIKDLIVENLST